MQLRVAGRQVIDQAGRAILRIRRMTRASAIVDMNVAVVGRSNAGEGWRRAGEHGQAVESVIDGHGVRTILRRSSRRSG